MAADVYGEPPFVGRGGWTWYTGAAAWMYRLAVERILGLRLRGGRLHFDPRVPRSWERFEIEVRHRGAELYIEVENPRGVNRGVERVELDGRRLAGNELPTLEAGRRHRVRVVLG
jgi:cellobiose phosphorylase